MKVVFLGATSGMGRALARALAQQGAQFVLLGRQPEQLVRSAADLEVHGADPPVHTVVCDLAERDTLAPALAQADRLLNGFDTVVVTAGVFATQDVLENDLDRAREVLDIDFTNTVLFCELARRRLLDRGGGTLCVFTSVAGDRPRKPVILYGAAKAGLSYYLEGLDHKYRAAGLRVIDVRPGFVRTRMTAGLKPPPFASNPDDVARVVLKALRSKRPVIYAPPVWRWIMLLIRHLPRFVLRRTEF